MRNKISDGCRELTLRQTARFLKKHDNYIILTHASPDGDTLGSAYALYYGLNEIGKKACVICPDIIPCLRHLTFFQINFIRDLLLTHCYSPFKIFFIYL